MSAARGGSQARPSRRDPRVEVVVITRDRSSELAHTLGILSELPEQPRITVVDNASSDDTREVVRGQFPHCRLLPAVGNLGAAGRNMGVRLCSSPYVAFCDDDTWWSAGSLSAAADFLDAYPRIAVATARIIVEPSGEEDPICEELRSSHLPPVAEVPVPRLGSFLAGASIVRRSAFLAGGGFHPRLLIGGEEELLAADLAAAGWEIAYVPWLSIHHRASEKRDPHQRRREGIRNTLWFTWLRRRGRSALRRTVRVAASIPKDAVSAGACAEAVAGFAWVTRERRPLPSEVDEHLQLLEPSQSDSKARRYVS